MKLTIILHGYINGLVLKGIKAEYYLQCSGLTKENPIFEYSNGKFLEKCFDNMIILN